MTGSSVSDSGVAGVAGDGDLEHAVVDEEDIVDGEGERRGKGVAAAANSPFPALHLMTILVQNDLISAFQESSELLTRNGRY